MPPLGFTLKVFKGVLRGHHIQKISASSSLPVQVSFRRILNLAPSGRVVGQIAAQRGPYNLLWCQRYKKTLPTWPCYRGDRRANYRRANIVSKLYLKYLLGYRQKKISFVLEGTRLANLPAPEQIIRTYLRCHLTYHSGCVNTGSAGSTL